MSPAVPGTGAKTLPAKIRLYELALENGRCASPFVWRLRYALAHKGIAFEIPCPCGLHRDCANVRGTIQDGSRDREPASRCLRRAGTLPSIWTGNFPQARRYSPVRPSAKMVRLMDAWFSSEVMRKLFLCTCWTSMMPLARRDRPYFRQSREARLEGRDARGVHHDRAARLPAIREALAPLRTQLSRVPFLGGSAPNYADYIVLGAFQCVASVSTLPLLARSDEVLRASGLERGFDLYGGLGRDRRSRPVRLNSDRCRMAGGGKPGKSALLRPRFAVMPVWPPSSARGAIRRASAPPRADANCR